MKLHLINKQVGETPLQALNKFRKQAKLALNAKLTYAGRLDPMASGVLLILENATQRQREKYMALPKVYKAQILFGLATDSFDLLGLPQSGPSNELAYSPTPVSLKKALKSFKGKKRLPIPPYSSVRYKNQPLFAWAKSGQLPKNFLMQRIMHIKQIQLIKTRSLNAPKLLKYIQKQLVKIQGDFRQDKILNAWQKILTPTKQKYLICQLLISCASGTYIRSLANELGKSLNAPSLLFSLKRLRVGPYPKLNPLR